MDVLHLTSYILPMQRVDVLHQHPAVILSRVNLFCLCCNGAFPKCTSFTAPSFSLVCTIGFLCDHILWEKVASPLEKLQGVKKSCSEHPSKRKLPPLWWNFFFSENCSYIPQKGWTLLLWPADMLNIGLYNPQQTQKCKHCQTSPCKFWITMALDKRC